MPKLAENNSPQVFDRFSVHDTGRMLTNPGIYLHIGGDLNIHFDTSSWPKILSSIKGNIPSQQLPDSPKLLELPLDNDTKHRSSNSDLMDAKEKSEFETLSDVVSEMSLSDGCQICDVRPLESTYPELSRLETCGQDHVHCPPTVKRWIEDTDIVIPNKMSSCAHSCDQNAD